VRLLEKRTPKRLTPMLADRYKPQMSGYTQSGRFSGYAAMFLPRRLGDAWHKWHPEHRYITDPETGKRGWHYDQPMISLDSLTNAAGGDSDQSDRHFLHAKPINGFCHAGTLRLPGRPAQPRDPRADAPRRSPSSHRSLARSELAAFA
jgi:hypothetical protein